MKFSICVDALYSGRDFADSIPAVKAAGFEAIEFWSWWKDRDIARIKALCDNYGLGIAAFCTKHMELTDPGERRAYLDGLAQSIEAAKIAGAKMLITTAGRDTSEPAEDQRRSIVDGLRAAAPMVEAAGITLLLEPLNIHNHVGTFLWSSDEAFRIVGEVGSPNVKLLFDIYHQQIMEGNIIERMTANLAKIGHVHAAGVPGRHELDTGELRYPAIFQAIERAGYVGHVGLEYFPVDSVEAGLRKLFESLK